MTVDVQLATPRLRTGRRRLVNAVGLGLWASGLAWLLLHYLLQAKGEFGPEPSPLEPWALKLHGLFAFASLWTLGLLWGVHVVNGWSLGRRRWSGGLLLGALGLLTASGWLLYYAGADEVRSATSVVHWAIGLGALPLYLAHRLIRQAVSRRGP